MVIGCIAVIESMMVFGEGHHVKCTSPESIFGCSEVRIVLRIDRLVVFIPHDGRYWVSEEFTGQTLGDAFVGAELVQVSWADCTKRLLGNCEINSILYTFNT